jgi:hypothetical protein
MIRGGSRLSTHATAEAVMFARSPWRMAAVWSARWVDEGGDDVAAFWRARAGRRPTLEDHGFGAGTTILHADHFLPIARLGLCR